MGNRFTMGDINTRLDWKDYQVRLNRIAATRRRTRRRHRYICVLILLIVIGLWTISGSSCSFSVLNRLQVSEKDDHHVPLPSRQPLFSEKKRKLLEKSEVRSFLDGNTFVNLTRNRFDFQTGGQNYRVITTLNPSLQTFTVNSLNPAHARYIGSVAMDPSTGKILCMAGFDKAEPSGNPCLKSIFPAASIFKIITASAAVDKCNFSQGTILYFTGGKHTLYKPQLSGKNTKNSQQITLLDAFAQSVNAVFGNIGIHYLGKTNLEHYASAFGFNKTIEFESAISPSFISIGDDSFHLAEIASGYNRETAISPLHGALIASVILNQGAMLEPTMIDRIMDDKGNLLYQNHIEPIRQVISSKSSEIMTHLMEATVNSGTGRKAFKDYRKDRTLSQLDIGGKTGTMDNQSHEVHYDWFVGYASDKSGIRRLAVAVVVAHEALLGVRSGQYARMVMKHYFTDFFDGGGHNP